VARPGYGLFVYRIELGKANRVRRQLGLPPLGKGQATKRRRPEVP